MSTKGDIFDQLLENSGKKESDIFDKIVSEQPSETRSKLSAFPKGLIKGTASLASMRDPIGAVLGLTDLSPFEQQALEKLLPTREEPLEKGLERAGKLVPAALGGGEGLLAKGARVAGGAALGQIAEEAGAPEWAQGLAELVAFMSPKGKFIPKKSQKEAVEFLREKGLTDKEIVPLIKNQNLFTRLLTEASAKSKKTEELGKGIKSKLGEGFQALKKTGAEKFLGGSEAVNFDDKLSEAIGEIRPSITQAITKDVEALRNRGISQRNLIDFYQDINSKIKRQEGGKEALGTLKPIILEGMEKIDPLAAKEFTKLNEFYAKNKQFIKSMKPGIIEKITKGSKLLGILGSLATLNFAFIPKILGTHASQLLIREFLLNPKLQNLSKQAAQAAKSNRFPIALKISEKLKEEIQKKNPELYKEIQNIDEE